jgi:hypothetical protein
MDTTNIWDKLHLYRKKIVIICLFGCFFVSSGLHAQSGPREINLPNYDDRWIHYGFVLGGHSSSFRINFNQTFTSPAMDSVHSVVSPNNFGFTIGFIVNLRLAQYLDFRILPAVTHYGHKLEYHYTDRTPLQQPFLDSWMVEFPLLLKYKSQRRQNNRMYLVGGIKPGIDATSRKDQGDASLLQIRKGNVSAEFGFGIDIYYPLFKFSPEIRFSKGLVNVLRPDPNPFNMGIDRMSINTFSVFLQFE